MPKTSKSKNSISNPCTTSNLLLIEVAPQFIALCESSGVTPQGTFRGMAAMVCDLRYDEHNHLLPLEGDPLFAHR
jgi:hypothetical protein